MTERSAPPLPHPSTGRSPTPHHAGIAGRTARRDRSGREPTRAPALVLGRSLGITLRSALAAALATVLAVGAVVGGLAPAAASDADPVPDPTAGAAFDGWRRPVPGAVAHPFDPPAEDWLPGHRGVDLAAGPGEEVRSPAAGVVSFAGPVAGKPVVVVAHAGGLRSTFEPVTAAVGSGDAVGPGDALGAVADVPGHCAPAGCLHWGVLRGDVYLDPLALLGEAAPIVLLPGGP